MSPFELQVTYRLANLKWRVGYKPQLSDRTNWKELMLDKKADVYGRLCAASFLLDESDEAREFVEGLLKSKDLRIRYNAAKIVQMHVANKPKMKWGVAVLIQLLRDRSIDGSGIHSSPSGEFPGGDGNDIMGTPIDDICYTMGWNKVTEAVPVLIEVLERQPRTRGASCALGEIGDPRAAAVLMKILKDRSNDDDEAVTALGKLRHKPAVPILISRLGKPRTTFSGMDISETEALLQALRDIGDKRAIEPIKEYLKGEYPNKAKAVAKRVLAQLELSDPVPALFALFEKEEYEPERSDILADLTKYPDERVTKHLKELAGSSPSAFMRREAIDGLGKIGNREALLALASLLAVDYPADLKAEWGWKVTPEFPEYFPKLIVERLGERTHQSFGRDQERWKDWISRNAK